MYLLQEFSIRALDNIIDVSSILFFKNCRKECQIDTFLVTLNKNCDNNIKLQINVIIFMMDHSIRVQVYRFWVIYLVIGLDNRKFS